MSEQGRQAELLAAASAFGRWLLQERELRALPREEVAKLTRLPPGTIEALESGDPDRMPPKAYVFGYLRTYAGAVGLDADDVVLRWQEVVGPEEAPGTRPRRLPLRALLLAALALVALALLILFVAGPRERAPVKLDRPRATERAPYPAGAPAR
ncbi:MAG TPA: helix-turn-helix transcriptional regulator [Anaeromyxobacteraceae bacterium]|nr:helix-turn-helix transcriptional regulator [Anaeromyxobacteraceae bacterium]